MSRLLAYIDEHAPIAYVSLVADPAGIKLYESVGFEAVAPSQGMARLNLSKKTE